MESDIREKCVHFMPSYPRFSNRNPGCGRQAYPRKQAFPASDSRLPQSAQKRFELLHRLPAVVCFLSSLTALANGRGEDKVELKRTLSGSLCLLRQLSGCPFRCANLCFLSSSISLEISALTDALCLLRSYSASNCRSLLRQSLQYGDSASE
jgi:hypothetical protein